jgi:hypothetical protein
MPPIKINTYDFNLSPTENLKANFLADRLAKNRWGNKFKRLYDKHDAATTDGTLGTYDFTAGMRSVVYSLSGYEADLAAAQAFKTKIYNDFEVSDGATWSIGHATAHSYMVVLIEKVQSFLYTKVETRGMHFSLSLDVDSGDGRKVSWFRSSGVSDATASVLKPLYDTSGTYGLHLVSSDGLPYGHYDGGLRADTTQNTALGLYSVENTSDPRFHADQESRFDDIWAQLLVFAGMMAKYMAPDLVGERASVVIGLGQILDFVERRIVTLQAAIDNLENSQTRTGDDLELIDHLGIADTLHDQITDPGEVERIWLMLEKEIDPPKIAYFDGGSMVVENDPNYEWWLEPQFDEIRKYVKNFEDYCTYHQWDIVNPRVTVNKEIFNLAGWKIFWYVSAFLDIDVDMEDPSLWEKLLNFVLFIISIVLIVVSGNPIWLKVILVTTTVMGYLGVLSPEVALVVAVLSFGYGVYSVDFSSLSSMEMFRWAIQNVSMVMDMVSMHEAIGVQKEIEDEARKEAKFKSTAETQEEAMNYIYTDAYSQYDDLYTVLYDFEPKYR